MARLQPIIAGVLTAALLLAAAPKPFGLHGHSSGSADLAQRVESRLSTGFRHHVAALELKPGGGTEFAGWGADAHTEFEIGSVTKTFTAALFADAVERGEVRPGDTLAAVFPEFRGTAAGTVTLEQLATQHSGLPRLLPSGPGMVALSLIGLDPYRVDEQELIRRAARLTPGPRKFGYSNLGFALLGQAVAKRASIPYPELVRTRLLQPLGMTETSVPTRLGDLPAGAPRGFTAAGLPAGAWTGMAHAPSGAVRSTAHDLDIWLRAVRDGSAPGATAAGPRAQADPDSPGERIGYAWIHNPSGVTWHNGGTGGFSALVGFRDDGAGIIVLADSAASVDPALAVIES